MIDFDSNSFPNQSDLKKILELELIKEMKKYENHSYQRSKYHNETVLKDLLNELFGNPSSQQQQNNSNSNSNSNGSGNNSNESNNGNSGIVFQVDIPQNRLSEIIEVYFIYLHYRHFIHSPIDLQFPCSWFNKRRSDLFFSFKIF